MRAWFVLTATVLLAAGARGAQCDLAAAKAKNPALGKLLDAAGGLREGAAKPGASFSQLVAQAQALAGLGEKSLGQIQQAGCKLKEAQLNAFESCTAPLTWSCESVRPGIDWSFLASVKRAEDEDLAFALGDAVLAGPANIFATCCGDFGCVDGGVGVPRLLYDKEMIAKLARLSGLDTQYGRAALETLKKSSAGIAKATCKCDDIGKEDLAEVIADLNSVGKEAGPQASPQLRSISAALKKGLPKSQCKMPGGGD
jgi:hypothetical protein